jgi:hypothetical protein
MQSPASTSCVTADFKAVVCLHHHACPAIASAEEDLFPVATRGLPPVATDREWS